MFGFIAQYCFPRHCWWQSCKNYRLLFSSLALVEYKLYDQQNTALYMAECEIRV